MARFFIEAGISFFIPSALGIVDGSNKAVGWAQSEA